MKRIKIPYKLVKQTNLKNLNETIERKEVTIKTATSFIKEIEKGNLDIEIEYSDQDELAYSIASMRDQIKRISLEEKERNWATEGMAKFVDILRTNNDNMKTLADDIITHLVKYLNAAQGALFMVNDENSSEPYLEMASCYAYERKKFLEKKIQLGEGLVGQTFLEKETTYLKEIPNNYINITSGLGKSLPKNILIVPLKINDEVYGIVEIASFNVILPYQVSFVERLGESIASTISSVKVNQQTKILLQESQSQTEEMKSQEEEVRQNMEELSATQEEMQRILNEVQANEAFMNDLINSTNDSIITVDTNNKIITCNKATLDTYKGSGFRIEKGFDIFKLFTEEQKPKYKAYFERALNGEAFEVTENYKFENREQYYSVNYSPLRNEKGEIMGAASFGKDVTESATSKLKAEELLEAAQQQAEEMKAQEEELRQNMEEISATQEEMERILKKVQANETFLNDLMNATKDSIITIDRDYKLISCNQATLDIFKLPELEKGFDILSFYTGEEKEKNKAIYDRALRGETFELNERYEIEGKEIYVSLNYCPLRNENKEIIGLACFNKDITETVKSRQATENLLKEAQQQAEELKAQEDFLKQNMEEISANQKELELVIKEGREREQYITELLDVTSDSIVTIDTNFKVISSNKAFKDFLSEKNTIVEKGFDILNMFSPDTHEEKTKLYGRVFKGETIEVNDNISIMNSEKQYFQVKHAPVRNEDGEIIAITIYTKDVTEIELLKLELTRKKK